MINALKEYILPLLGLFIVFYDEIFNCAAIVIGLEVDTGMKQYEAMILAVIGYGIMSYDILFAKLKYKNSKVVLFLFAILFLYSLSSLFYGGGNEYHTSYLLVYGSECIPAAYIGVRLAKSISIYKINDILPFFIIPISILIGTIGVAAAMVGETVNKNSGYGVEAGLNYQTLSYFMAFCYSYCFYYVFYGNRKSGYLNALLRFIIVIDMLYCAMVCLTGGGRGGFVSIVAITVFMLYYYLKSSKSLNIHAFVIVLILFAVFVSLVNVLGVMQSSGMARVSEKLTEDDARVEMYKSAFNVFLSSPLFGKGIGSIWWTVGFYCHNIILDLLAETGIIGVGIFVKILWNTLTKLYKILMIEKVFLFFLLVLVGELVHSMFSGYWIAAYKLFFICSLAYCLPSIQARNQVNCSKVIQ